MGSRDDVATRIDANTNTEIENMKKLVANNKEKVMAQINRIKLPLHQTLS